MSPTVNQGVRRRGAFGQEQAHAAGAAEFVAGCRQRCGPELVEVHREFPHHLDRVHVYWGAGGVRPGDHVGQGLDGPGFVIRPHACHDRGGGFEEIVGVVDEAFRGDRHDVELGALVGEVAGGFVDGGMLNCGAHHPVVLFFAGLPLPHQGNVVGFGAGGGEYHFDGFAPQEGCDEFPGVF